MANLRVFACFTLLIIVASKSEANPYLTANDTFQNMENLLRELDGQKFLIASTINKTFLSIHSDEVGVYNQIKKISSDTRPNFARKIKELYQYFHQIDYAYKMFVDIFTNYHNYNVSKEILKFVESTTSYSLVELQATVEKMHEVFDDRDAAGESIISIIADETTLSDAMHLQKSVQQVVYALYETVTDMNTKAFVTTAYCYNLRESFENQSYEYRKNRLIVHYNAMVWSTFQKLKRAMHVTDRKLLRADPDSHQKDITYSRLYPVLQGVFIYEPDTTAGGWYTFWHQCESLKSTRLKVPDHKSCAGVLRDCRYIDSSIDICPSTTDDRIYSWAVTKSNDVYGHKNSECPVKLQNTYGVLTYDVCLCTCESAYVQKDRYFCLRNVVSDSDNNKVITGARLVKKGNVLYIQIQQGTLGANGSIVDVPQWQPVKEESPRNLHNNKNVYQVNYDQNTVFLDVLKSQPAYALTGLRFQKAENSLRLEAQITNFNYETGNLRLTNSWLSNPNGLETRERLKLVNPDVPIIMPEHNKITHNNRYVSFRMTNLRKDLGQTIVPFIDTQEIVTNPPMPLAGAGLYHKGRKHSGGFLGIQLLHYNFAHHM
ncbi:uncharacterized protein LOC100117668 isoform X2 [Nasonia vitripennis]|uniref:Uncharacterized protein n=1 Tax=Nasonia vitripennis TaxID=7425 RepID=A0A7M7G2Z5_NASVI|nr:uncharacterized protein LOC100117668 isoform X2 [Nasonia vitripennis]